MTLDPPTITPEQHQAEHEKRVTELAEQYGRGLAWNHKAHSKPIIVNGEYYASSLLAGIVTGIPQSAIRNEANNNRGQQANYLADRTTGRRIRFTAHWA